MTYIILILRLLLLGFSCYGYIRFLCSRIRAEFSIGVLFTSICSLMFFSGILNIMKETAWGIFALGLVLAILSIRRKESLRVLLCPGVIFFAAASVFLLVWLQGSVFTDYDDFSHWATVLKVMTRKDGFPNYTDEIIAFQSYPLGSASFIYYFLTISGITAEWYQLFSQAVFMLGAAVSLFAFAKEWKSCVLAAVVSLMLLLCNNGIQTLLVDTLLPLVAVGGFAFCFYYRNALRQHLHWVIPYMVSLVAIKNSGILFALFILAFSFFYMEKKKNGLLTWLGICASPFLTLLLWQRHVKQVFDDGLNAKHTMSIQSLTDNYLLKESEDIRSVIHMFLQELFSVQNHVLYLVLLVLLLFLIGRLFRIKVTKDAAMLMVFSAGFYAVYAAGLLGMYLTSMPIGEAMQLAGYSRYHHTILIFCAAIVYLAVMEWFPHRETAKKHQTRQLAAYGLTCVLFFQALFPCLWYNNPKYAGFVREDFESLVAEYDIQPERQYFVLVDSEYASKYTGYLKYLIRYLLDSTDIVVCSIDEYPELENGWEGYDYLIHLGDSDEMNAYLLDEYGTTEQRIMEAEPEC